MSGTDVRRLVDEFWRAAGQTVPFPRDLEGPISWALPLAITRLPRLWLRDAEAWLEQASVPFSVSCTDRPLHGCLVAFAGRGWVLLDGTDPDDERRFTLAHEAAHFICDYLESRRAAVRRLGPGVLDVLDGVRPATLDERADAVLSGIPLGVHTHLMERRLDGGLRCTDTLGAETRADLLALELVAPAAEVRRRVIASGRPAGFEERVERTATMLTGDFGLPPAIATPYGWALCRAWFGGPSFREWLSV